MQGKTELEAKMLSRVIFWSLSVPMTVSPTQDYFVYSQGRFPHPHASYAVHESKVSSLLFFLPPTRYVRLYLAVPSILETNRIVEAFSAGLSGAAPYLSQNV